MYCPSCGQQLSRQMKYCNHCGNQLTLERTTEIEKKEKRFDDYVDGVFWIAVFGMGLILGGTAVINKFLHLPRGVMIGFLILSTSVFLTVFGVCLWQVIQIAKELKELKRAHNDLQNEEQYDTNRLEGEKPRPSLDAPASIVEEPTRTLYTNKSGG